MTRAELIEMLRDTNARHNLPPGLLLGVARTESSLRPNAKSPAGALGLMQFMPATAAEWNIDPLDPAESADAAARYLTQLHERFGAWTLALAAYNWGQGNLRKALRNTTPWPVETDRYVRRVYALAE